MISYAAECECSDILRFLLGSRKVNPNKPDLFGNYPIHYAVKKTEIIENLRLLLIFPSIDVNVVNSKKNTPLLEAVECRNYNAFNLILDSSNIIDINAENEKGETAIFLALKYKAKEIIGYLISIDIDPLLNNFNFQKGILNPVYKNKPFYNVDFFHLTKKNENLFHYACLYCEIDLIKLFLNLKGIDLNLMSDEGTPLYYAFKSKNIDTVKFILDSVPDIRKENITIYYFCFLCYFKLFF